MFRPNFRWPRDCLRPARAIILLSRQPFNRLDGFGCDRDTGGIRDSKQRESVIVPFELLKGAKAGELTAKFDIFLGYTPKA